MDHRQRGPGRLRAHRLPTQSLGLLTRQRAGRGAGGAHPDPVRVLRAGGRRPAAAQCRAGQGPPQPGAARVDRSCSRCTTPGPGSPPRWPTRCGRTSPTQVLRTTIPRSVRISEAPSYGQTVMTYDPGSTGALSYLEAAREMAVRGPATPATASTSGESIERRGSGPRPGRPDPDRTRQGDAPAPAVAGDCLRSRRRPVPRPAAAAEARRRVGTCDEARAPTAAIDGPRPGRRTSPSSRSTRISPNPRQPREVFDEDAMAELVHSIREVGLLQPVVVRPLGADALRADHGRAALAGRAARPAWTRSRRSSGTPTTTTCCATRCWRTCTAPSSTRSRRPRPTTSCWTTSAARTTSWPPGSVAPARRSPTPCGCCKLPAAGPAPGRGRRPLGRSRPGAAGRWTTRPRRSGWPSGSWPRASRCARSRRSCRSAASRADRPARRREPAAVAPRSTTWPTGSPTGSTPG